MLHDSVIRLERGKIPAVMRWFWPCTGVWVVAFVQMVAEWEVYGHKIMLSLFVDKIVLWGRMALLFAGHTAEKSVILMCLFSSVTH